MLYLKKSGEDLFNSGAQTLVNPVNVNGVMGKGLALEFRNRYPEMFKAYRRACLDKVFERKGIFVWTEPDGKKILCLPTKVNWWQPSKLVWIDNGLEIIARDYKELGITSLALPAIGCGNGQLNWEDVLPLIRKHLGHLDIEVDVYPGTIGEPPKREFRGIRHGEKPFFECSSAGKSDDGPTLSAFYAKIKGRGNKTIETIYQASKVFEDGSTGLHWREAKGKKAINQEEVNKLYSQLWDEYIEENPHLISFLIRQKGLSDIFGQEGHCCQATELWRIRMKYIDQ